MGKVLGAWVLVAASLLVTGCVVEASVGAGPGVAVSGPPPEPVNEQRPAAPGPQATWIAGYWHWTGLQYTWIPGHWEEAPAGKRWRAPHYSLRDGTYFYEPGGWSTPPPPR